MHLQRRLRHDVVGLAFIFSLVVAGLRREGVHVLRHSAGGPVGHPYLLPVLVPDELRWGVATPAAAHQLNRLSATYRLPFGVALDVRHSRRI